VEVSEETRIGKEKRRFSRGSTDAYVVDRVVAVYRYDTINDIRFQKANPFHKGSNGEVIAKLSKVLSDLMINLIEPISMGRLTDDFLRQVYHVVTSNNMSLRTDIDPTKNSWLFK